MSETKNDGGPAFPLGPWTGEPNRVDWIDEASGLRCLIIRHPRFGHLCGYVGVAQDHPAHGALSSNPYWEIDDIISGAAAPLAIIAKQMEALRVHGGVTFSGPMEGEDGGMWWIGFDCTHARDVEPSNASRIGMPTGWGDVYQYRTIDYVRAETTILAAQLSRFTRVADAMLATRSVS